MVQYCDNNVEQYCIDIPIFDNLASDEIEGASEEDETIALMVLATYFTPKQEDEEVIEEDGEEDLRKQDGEEDHGDGHVLSLFPKMQDVVCEVLPTVKCLIEPKIEGLIEPKVEDFLQDFLSEVSPVQLCPKVGKDLWDNLRILWEWCSLEQVLRMKWE
ncbi:hypothetical protein Acr_19g0004440 [Actinidia rufa]|uniref:Uncharacterized protein n=1 Tax=Actinidia rufa TaxID=165716 RepID=A0A7J0G9M2_9ERIC|nr:hypothetical protein Acr_19g0004440 [Actinidia rufa]